jgi:hypothetical protein
MEYLGHQRMPIRPSQRCIGVCLDINFSTSP